MILEEMAFSPIKEISLRGAVIGTSISEGGMVCLLAPEISHSLWGPRSPHEKMDLAYFHEGLYASIYSPYTGDFAAVIQPQIEVHIAFLLHSLPGDGVY